MNLYEMRVAPTGNAYTDQAAWRGLAAGIVNSVVKDLAIYAKRLIIWKKRDSAAAYLNYQTNKKELRKIYEFFHSEHPCFGMLDLDGDIAWQKLMQKYPKIRAVIIGEFGTKYLK